MHGPPWWPYCISFDCEVFSLVCFFLGNIIVIITIGINKKLHSVTNFFITQLALGDIFILAMCMPFTVTSAYFFKVSYLQKQAPNCLRHKRHQLIRNCFRTSLFESSSLLIFTYGQTDTQTLLKNLPFLQMLGSRDHECKKTVKF